MTSTVHDPTALLRRSLEEQFERYTDQLADLTVRNREPDGGGYDDTLAPLVASVRQTLADTTHALRRITDGSYGTCERCDAGIPLERLEFLPHARFCVPCQRQVSG